MLLFFRLILIIIFIVLIISFIISLLLLFSEIKIILNTLEYTTEKNSKYTGKIGIYFLGKIKIFSKKIDSKKTGEYFKNNYIKHKIKRLNIFNKTNTSNKYKRNKNIIKELRKYLKIDMLKLEIQIDTESVLLTSYLVGIISAIIPNIIRNNIKKYSSKDYEWNIIPKYENKYYISLKLNSIISIKVVHIINMLKLIGGIKNERTSNRRLNVNCYGEH